MEKENDACPAFALLTNIVSPHQVPLASELVQRLGAENYLYVHTDAQDAQRSAMGWDCASEAAWCRQGDETSPGLEDCGLLFSELRAEGLFRKRLAAGKMTCYVSERWFKPPLGFLRMLSPAYWRMARRFAGYLESDRFFYFAQGIHAARDMMRVQGLTHGDLRCLFRAPKVAFESRPGGRIVPLQWATENGLLSREAIQFGKRHGFAQIPREHWGKCETSGKWGNYRLWGYFVAPAEPRTRSASESSKVLWVGRMLDWKRVGTLVRALPDAMELNLYGHGPEEERLRRMARDKGNVHFHDFVPIAEVRGLMRGNDVYVLPSDGGEGWGAVLNEALEEGMKVLATLESGAGGTMLPREQLFSAGDVRELREKLSSDMPRGGIGEWSVSRAAEFMVGFLRSVVK